MALVVPVTKPVSSRRGSSYEAGSAERTKPGQCTNVIRRGLNDERRGEQERDRRFESWLLPRIPIECYKISIHRPEVKRGIRKRYSERYVNLPDQPCVATFSSRAENRNQDIAAD
ncbi:hypothetical protein KM043_009814 [Ampulex compressa]|nr:hypothetical protein KM043_009814 [Ampulex compressa]